MIEFMAKKAPPLWGLFLFAVLLAILFSFNWLMADTFGGKIVKYSDECVVGEYNVETNTGSLTCGEYTKKDGTSVVSRFVGKVYVMKNSIACEITQNEYSGKVEWDCQEILSEQGNDS